MNKFILLLRTIDWYFSKNILRKKVIRRRLKDFYMYLDLKTPGISKTLAVHHIREADKILLIKEYLKEGMTVLDCGSNIGFYPLLEAQIIKNTAKIYAFEPDKRNFIVLEKNISLCSIDNVIKAYNMAISNRTGIEKMLVATKSNLSKLYASDNQSFIERHTIEGSVNVNAISVDEFCSRENIQIDFVRMDIEGYEVEVFKGMKETFHQAQSGFIVLVELHPHAYSKERSFATELEKLLQQGFEAKVIISAGVPIPSIYKSLGYHPVKEIKDGNFTRGWYENIKNEDVVQLTCAQPKASRYILLQKK